jgi:RNA polymerase sigma-70 factor (ECF subfamily)
VADVANTARRDGRTVTSTDTSIGRAATTELPLDARLEDYRAELRAYCRRLLGSAFDADDAVQETMVRAWRAIDGFEGRASVRSWLYRIAGNVCTDLLRGRQRRPDPVDLTAGAEPGPAPSSAVPGNGAVTTRGGGLDDPADVAVTRESVSSALAVAVQLLPPRQRAVLILREVLRWRADEVAELLGTTVASVNSALQRARATLALQDLSATDVAAQPPWRRSPGRDVRPDQSTDDAGGSHRTDWTLVVGFVDAFVTDDVDALVSLVRDDMAAA